MGEPPDAASGAFFIGSERRSRPETASSNARGVRGGLARLPGSRVAPEATFDAFHEMGNRPKVGFPPRLAGGSTSGRPPTVAALLDRGGVRARHPCDTPRVERDAAAAGDCAPRAPTQAEWDRLSEAARAAVVEALPAAMSDAEMSPPEGDRHYEAKNDARATLREWYRRRGKSVYVAAELTTYYPGEARFAPDVLAVREVSVHERMKWVVSAEGKGLDWVLEVHVGGDRKKDAEINVARYARLGIPEYFIYDRARQQLLAYRLAHPDDRTYARIVGQGGLYPSEVLGLDLAIQDGRLRFFHANAELLAPRELAERLEGMLQEVSAERDAEAERARVEAERARAEAERAARAEAELAKVREELERLQKERR